MEVAPHSSLKHRMLGAYFKICRQVMKKRTLYYVDLYAGDGECECHEAPMTKWKCPFIVSLLGKAQPEKLKLKCLINELDKNNYEKLKTTLSQYSSFIISLTNEDANKVFKQVLKQCPPSEWSIVFLDPYKHNDLDWKTIEEISKHEGVDPVNSFRRKPELIINLATLSMQRTIKDDPDAITRALGTDKWKQKINNSDDKKMHEVFLEVFTEQLEKLGYSTVSFCISQTPPNSNVLYYLVFASNIPTASKIIEDKYKPYIDKIIDEKWVKENFRCRMITKAKDEGYKPLNEYM